MSLAQWITSPNLGSYVENYNFNINPLTIEFASDSNSVVITLNGSLPPGLQYTQISNTLVISGVSTGVTTSTISYITFRVTDSDGTLDDRTYNITITPIAIIPNWDSQNPFLGYMTVNTTSTFTVTATIDNNSIINYSLVPAPNFLIVPIGMTINQYTGVITYTNTIPLPVPVAFDETYSVTVVATSGEYSEDLTVTVTVLGTDHAPGWITNAGSLGTYVIDQWVEIVFQSYDPNNTEVAYALLNPPVGFPFTLTPTGFLYGQAPLTSSDMLWIFEISATGSAGVSYQNFEIQVVSESNVQLNWNNPTGELGTWLDGNFITIPVTATSSRSQRIVYEFRGGMLPPDLKLNTFQGVLAGFLEFHAQPRDYYFEIQAFDGIAKIYLQYHIQVERSVNDMFANVLLPVQGQLKQTLLDTRESMIQSGLMVPNINVQPFVPIDSMNLISGLSYYFDNTTYIMQQIFNEAHSTDLLIGVTDNVSISNEGYTVFYQNVIDLQANASPTTTRLVGNITAGNTLVSYNPISLNNIRSALISDIGFVNDGLGVGASFIATVNQYTTAITNVMVANSGAGYYSSPTLVVTGTGNGAVLTANLTVQSVNITSNGSGWTQGEIFNVIIDSSHVIVLQATNVGATGSLQEVTILDGGDFNLFPHSNKVISNGNSAIATVGFNLGINSVNIVSGGTGYSSLTQQNVIVSGSEILPIWQPVWQPILYIGTIESAYDNSVFNTITPQLEINLENIVWTVQWLEIVAQGRAWSGNTSFDENKCSMDGGATRFIESIIPTDTIFDNDGNTTFDIQGTVFDNNYGYGVYAYDVWNNKVWDPNISIFDVFSSLLGDIDADLNSTTAIKQIFRLKSQRVGDYNRSY